MPIEAPGLLVDGVYEQCAHAHDLRRLSGAKQGILEQGLAQALPSLRLIDGE